MTSKGIDSLKYWSLMKYLPFKIRRMFCFGFFIGQKNLRMFWIGFLIWQYPQMINNVWLSKVFLISILSNEIQIVWWKIEGKDILGFRHKRAVAFFRLWYLFSEQFYILKNTVRCFRAWALLCWCLAKASNHAAGCSGGVVMHEAAMH